MGSQKDFSDIKAFCQQLWKRQMDLEQTIEIQNREIDALKRKVNEMSNPMSQQQQQTIQANKSQPNAGLVDPRLNRLSNQGANKAPDARLILKPTCLLSPTIHPISAIPPMTVLASPTTSTSTTTTATTISNPNNRRSIAYIAIPPTSTTTTPSGPGAPIVVDNSFYAHRWSTVTNLKNQTEQQLRNVKVNQNVASQAEVPFNSSGAYIKDPNNFDCHEDCDMIDDDESSKKSQEKPPTPAREENATLGSTANQQRKDKGKPLQESKKTATKERSNPTPTKKVKTSNGPLGIEVKPLPMGEICDLSEEELKRRIAREKAEDEDNGVLRITFKKYPNGLVRMRPVPGQNMERFRNPFTRAQDKNTPAVPQALKEMLDNSPF